MSKRRYAASMESRILDIHQVEISSRQRVHERHHQRLDILQFTPAKSSDFTPFVMSAGAMTPVAP
jgi:hypothetical protein